MHAFVTLLGMPRRPFGKSSFSFWTLSIPVPKALHKCCCSPVCLSCPKDCILRLFSMHWICLFVCDCMKARKNDNRKKRKEEENKIYAYEAIFYNADLSWCYCVAQFTQWMGEVGGGGFWFFVIIMWDRAPYKAGVEVFVCQLWNLESVVCQVRKLLFFSLHADRAILGFVGRFYVKISRQVLLEGSMSR